VLSDLSTRIAEFRADLAVGETSRIVARLAYARALATKIAAVADKQHTSFPRLAAYARDARNDLNEIETAMRTSNES
jgi:hypothetical protein